MIVECIRQVPTAEQAAWLGKNYRPGEQEFPVEPGRRYVVFGLRVWERGTWIDIQSDVGYLVVVPLCLFTVVDGRVSALWEARLDGYGNLDLLPARFHDKYFVDDLVDGESEVLKEFWRVRALLMEDVPEQFRKDVDLPRTDAATGSTRSKLQ